MTSPVTPTVLILSDDRLAAARWREWLGNSAEPVWIDPADVPADGQVDVLVFDSVAVRSRFDASQLPRRGEDFAAIAIGCTAQADVMLPADATGRELRLACTLLGQIVHFRRAQDRQSRMHQTLTKLALVDSLTDLANRRAWDAELLARADDVWRGKSLCLAIIDLDLFKQVNDELGHTVGDAVLKATASSLKSQLRQCDFVARLGGDEFGWLMAEVDQARADAVVERVRAGLTRGLAEAAGRSVTASAGYAVAPQLVEGTAREAIATALYAAADRGLRLAKQLGRNRTSTG